MIEIVDKQFLKKRVTVWFPDDGYRTKQRCDVCCYVGISQLHNTKNAFIKFNSLISDLSKPSEEIFQQFAKVNRYDIRRSSRDPIQVVVFESKEIIGNNHFYDQYKRIYENMYKQKGLIKKAPIEAMNYYAVNGALSVTAVYLEGEPIVFHAYIIDGRHARLWMSCSMFRDNEDKQYRALMGRANKRLHYEDMLNFSNNGYITYDWGGISSFDTPNGIDQFKMSFGGKHITYYDETVLMSWKYKLIHKMKRLLKH